MQQLSIFEIPEEIAIVPRQGIIKNQVSIYYKNCHIANAKKCINGLYEVRPRAEYFTKRDLAIQTMNEEEIREFCKKSFAHYEV